MSSPGDQILCFHNPLFAFSLGLTPHEGMRGVKVGIRASKNTTSALGGFVASVVWLSALAREVCNLFLGCLHRSTHLVRPCPVTPSRFHRMNQQHKTKCYIKMASPKLPKLSIVICGRPEKRKPPRKISIKLQAPKSIDLNPG